MFSSQGSPNMYDLVKIGNKILPLPTSLLSFYEFSSLRWVSLLSQCVRQADYKIIHSI